MKRGAWLLVLASCSVLSKNKPLEVRYFAPPSGTTSQLVASRGDESFAPSPPTTRLRLGRVDASAYLRERIAYRDSAVGLRLYDDLRWTEDPDAFVRRAITHALFDRRLEQALGGAVPVLDIEVLAFEEVRIPHRARSARVTLGYRLRDDRDVIASGTFMADRPVHGEGVEPFVAAIGAALQEASERVAETVTAKVEAR
jgi:ABC-type uncharacterized transport system auxiliary subunit